MPNYKDFRQELEKYKVITEKSYKELEKKFGSKELKKLFETYINDSTIIEDDKKINLTSYYIEQILINEEDFEFDNINSNSKNDDINSNQNTKVSYSKNNYINPLTIYLNQIGTNSILTKEEEIELAMNISSLKKKITTKKLTDKYFEENLKKYNYPHPSKTDTDIRRSQLKYINNQLNTLLNKKELLNNKACDSSQKLLEELNITINELTEFEKNLELQYNYQKSIDKFIESNLKLVIIIAKKYSDNESTLLDLIQEGNIGLRKAIDKYNPTMGYKFSTYATYWIRQAILRNVGNTTRTIKIPVYFSEIIRKINLTEVKLAEKLNRTPTIEELASELNISVEKLKQYRKQGEVPISISTPLKDKDEYTLEDVIIDEQNVEEIVFNHSLKVQLKKALSTLTPREQLIISLRFGLDDGRIRKLEEIGQNLKLTRERVRQIEKKALSKLQSPVRSKLLKDYI